MKSLLISIKPKWVVKILNGDKTIEVRKNKALAKAIQKLIDENGYAEIYVYCSKEEHLYRTNKGYHSSKKPLEVGKGTEYSYCYSDEGKVAFKFRCYKVEEYPYVSDRYDELIGSCLSEKELLDYSTISFKDNVRVVKSIYAIHISNLEIFDRPKELGRFMPAKWDKCGVKDKNGLYQCNKCPYGDKSILECNYKPLTKAPQNMCYIEVEE